MTVAREALARNFTLISIKINHRLPDNRSERCYALHFQPRAFSVISRLKLGNLV